MEDLSQTTFIIPTYIDSDERARNLKIKLSCLLGDAATTIIVLEHDHEPRSLEVLNTLTPDLRTKIHHHFVRAAEGEVLFYRTKLLNEIFTDIMTPVVCLSSCDAICPTEQYVEAESLALEGVPNYPYSLGRNRTEINYWGKELLEKTVNLDFVEGEFYKTTELESSNRSELFITRKQWLQVGLENENLIFSAAEPTERALRIEFVLGEPVKYRDPDEKAQLFSLFHPPTTLSTPFTEENKELLANMEYLYVDSSNKKKLFKTILEDAQASVTSLAQETTREKIGSVTHMLSMLETLSPDMTDKDEAIRSFIEENTQYLEKYGLNI